MLRALAKRIASSLAAASTPLTGSEIVEVLQSGVSKQTTAAAIAAPIISSWTPNQGSGLTVVGSFSSTGTIVKMGRFFVATGTLTGSTSIAAAAVGVLFNNMPYSTAVAMAGQSYNSALTAGAVLASSGTTVYASEAIAATGTITFTAFGITA